MFRSEGGTAINLFVRDLPRLSVDIDVAYIHVNQRDEALVDIDAAFRALQSGIWRKTCLAFMSPVLL